MAASLTNRQRLTPQQVPSIRLQAGEFQQSEKTSCLLSNACDPEQVGKEAPPDPPFLQGLMAASCLQLLPLHMTTPWLVPKSSPANGHSLSRNPGPSCSLPLDICVTFTKVFREDPKVNHFSKHHTTRGAQESNKQALSTYGLDRLPRGSMTGPHGTSG
jgi:hypothetical protein